MDDDRPSPPRWPARGLWMAVLAGGSALVAATWLVAQLSWQGRVRALEAELDLLRRTRQLDLPQLLLDLRRVAGPAADRLALQELRERHATLEREHKTTVAALEALRRSRRLEERFTLPAGGSRELLEGKVPLVVESVEAETAQISLAGAPANLWHAGDFRDLNFGGGRYRLTLERFLPRRNGEAAFRLDALLDNTTPLTGR